VLTKLPQLNRAFKVRKKKPLETLPALSGAIAALERELGAQGRVLVRYSGTGGETAAAGGGPTAAVVQAGLNATRNCRPRRPGSRIGRSSQGLSNRVSSIR